MIQDKHYCPTRKGLRGHHAPIIREPDNKPHTMSLDELSGSIIGIICGCLGVLGLLLLAQWYRVRNSNRTGQYAFFTRHEDMSNRHALGGPQERSNQGEDTPGRSRPERRATDIGGRNAGRPLHGTNRPQSGADPRQSLQLPQRQSPQSKEQNISRMRRGSRPERNLSQPLESSRDATLERRLPSTPWLNIEGPHIQLNIVTSQGRDVGRPLSARTEHGNHPQRPESSRDIISRADRQRLGRGLSETHSPQGNRQHGSSQSKPRSADNGRTRQSRRSFSTQAVISRADSRERRHRPSGTHSSHRESSPAEDKRVSRLGRDGSYRDAMSPTDRQYTERWLSETGSRERKERHGSRSESQSAGNRHACRSRRYESSQDGLSKERRSRSWQSQSR
jgi:hypothetical protein